jgi:hypothetical protein
MAVLPPAKLTTVGFWDSEQVLNLARVLVNDAQGGLSGQDLSDSQPYTWPLLNFCYAKLASWLEDSNVESATYSEAVIGPLTAAPNAIVDPNATVRLGYDGYWDGGSDETFAPYKLPDDCLMPLELWERPSAYPGPFLEMKQVLGGLPPRAGFFNFRYWEFRQNAIYMPGAIQSNLVRLRYIPALPLLIQPLAGKPYPQIPLAQCGTALAYMVAAEFAEIRNAQNAVNLRAKANEELDIISNRSAKRENQVDQRRRGYGFGRRRQSWR